MNGIRKIEEANHHAAIAADRNLAARVMANERARTNRRQVECPTCHKVVFARTTGVYAKHFPFGSKKPCRMVGKPIPKVLF